MISCEHLSQAQAEEGKKRLGHNNSFSTVLGDISARDTTKPSQSFFTKKARGGGSMCLHTAGGGEGIRMGWLMWCDVPGS